eukprot:TRINITY_DN290_c3_g1_i1.p1 TRINITY_DN290_c3_g1~~TRINITY_DN290_c3_g1_i1.p1  ORF type:complete len:200 (-),score=100.46 TRINITY_DN290_c3_g1_i1:171-770(-)
MSFLCRGDDDPNSWIPFFDSQDPLPSQVSPYAPSMEKSIECALELANISNRDIVLDLGCGDGRVCIIAAEKYGARAIGIDIDEQLLDKGRKIAIEKNLTHLVELRNASFIDESFDLNPATIIYLYLMPKALRNLEPKIKNYVRNSNHIRICSSVFTFSFWKPSKIDDQMRIYLYDSNSEYLVNPDSNATENANVCPTFI